MQSLSLSQRLKSGKQRTVNSPPLHSEGYQKQVYPWQELQGTRPAITRETLTVKPWIFPRDICWNLQFLFDNKWSGHFSKYPLVKAIQRVKTLVEQVWSRTFHPQQFCRSRILFVPLPAFTGSNSGRQLSPVSVWGSGFSSCLRSFSFSPWMSFPFGKEWRWSALKFTMKSSALNG